MNRTDVVVEAGNLLGESPVWDDRRTCLWWIDIHGRSLHRQSTAHGHGVWPLPEQVGCIGLCEDGRLVCGTRRGFALFDPATRELEHVAMPLSGASNVRFNDGRCDRQGRFWSGTVQELRVVGDAALYRLGPNADCRRIMSGLTVVNGRV